MSLLDMCRRTVRRTFGVERLWREQQSAMVAILDGRDAPVALPTGFGKSLIYQAPAMIIDWPTIVVSPLIALMADQERTLASHRVPVIVLHSRLCVSERRATLAQLEAGGRLVVLATPETLESGATAPSFECSRPNAPVRGRGPLHLGMGARLPTVLFAAGRCPRAAWQPWGSPSDAQPEYVALSVSDSPSP